MNSVRTPDPVTLRRRSSWLDLMIDGVVAAAYTIGLADAIYTFRGLAGSLWLTVFSALAAVLLLVLLSRHWWIIPAAVGLPGLLAVFILWRLDRLSDVWGAIADYAGWATGWLLVGAPDPAEPYWLPLLRLLLLLPIAAAAFALVRKVTWLPLYGGLIVLIYIPLLIWYPTAVPALLFSLGGFILMLPRRFLIQLRLERPQDTLLPRAPLQLLAIPAVIAGLLLAQLMVPSDTLRWRLPALANPINDIGDLWQTKFGKIRAHDLFSIGPIGFQPAGSRLGGPVNLSKRGYLWVTADRPMLLKGNTSSIYDGSSWTSPTQRSYRLESGIWWQFRNDAFDQGLPGGAAGRRFLSRYGKSLKLDIETQTPWQNTLFAAGRVQTVNLADKLNYAPYFAGDGTLFVWRGMPTRYRYTIETLLLDRKAEGFDTALLDIEAEASADVDRNWDQVCRDYLQLPGDLPKSVAETAKNAAAAATTPYGRAVLLEDYFKTGFTYSLTPEFPPAGTDFVAYFLEHRTGYCVYYATALAVMARTLGIPSRYVEGFATQLADSSKPASSLWQATGQTAHAWVELYFKGIGWITFDPTPAGYTEINSNPNPVISPSMGPTGFPNLPTPTPGQPPNNGQGAGLGWLLALFALILAIFGYLSYAQYRNGRRFDVERIRRRHPHLSDQLLYYYQEILKQLSVLNIVPETGDTLVQFAGQAERYLRLEGLPVPEILWPVSRWFYGAKQPTAEEVERLALLCERVEKRLRSNLSAPAYFIRRILGITR
jgi:transglutaminase-like putative cysteine protease